MSIHNYRAAVLQRAFKRQWRLSGRIYATVVQPYTSWTVPDGYTFNKSKQLFEDEDGNKLASPETYRETDLVKIIPAGRSAHVANMMIAGILPRGSSEVFVWVDDLAKIRVSHSIIINDITYRRADTSGTPVGDEQWSRVVLERK